MKKDLLARAGRLATLGRRAFGVSEERFPAYLEALQREAERARREYDLLVIPGAEITQNRLTGRKNAHIIALDIKRYISADQPADAILREIRRQDALSVACHPHHRAVRRLEISTCYLWDNRRALSDLVDVWEAANRDDLFSVTSLKHFPYVASSDFHKPKHLYSWKTLLRCAKHWPDVRRALCDNVDVALTLFRKGSWAGSAAACPRLSLPLRPVGGRPGAAPVSACLMARAASGRRPPGAGEGRDCGPKASVRVHGGPQVTENAEDALNWEHGTVLPRAPGFLPSLSVRPSSNLRDSAARRDRHL